MVPTLLESIGRKLKLQRSGAHHFGLYNSVVIYTCVGTHWASSIHIKVCGKPESGHRVLRAHSLTYIQTDRETASLTHFEAFKFLRCGDRLQISYPGWSREDFMREAARLAALLAIRLLPMHDDFICMLSKSVLSCPLHLENRPSAWFACDDHLLHVDRGDTQRVCGGHLMTAEIKGYFQRVTRLVDGWWWIHQLIYISCTVQSFSISNPCLVSLDPSVLQRMKICHLKSVDRFCVLFVILRSPKYS